MLESGSKCKMFCMPDEKSSYHDDADNVFSSINVHLILLIPLYMLPNSVLTNARHLVRLGPGESMRIMRNGGR